MKKVVSIRVGMMRTARGREVKTSLDISKLAKHSREHYLHLKRNEKECYVAPSPICGKGLYVMQEVEKGDVLMEYTGKRIEHKTLVKEEKREPMKYAHEEYMLRTGGTKVVIDASSGALTDAKYANHSCSPNCEFVTEVLSTEDGGVIEVVFIYAIETVYMFQEITVGYNLNVGKKTSGIICNCKSNNCVGVVGRIHMDSMLGGKRKGKK